MSLVLAVRPVLAVQNCTNRSVCRWVLDRTHNETLASVVEWFVRAPLRIAGIIAVAMAVSAILGRIIARTMAGVARVSPRGDDRARQRTATLTTVLRSSVAGIVWMLAAVTVVGELGVNIGAFVATATIIGGALAFGAQEIVKDFLAGMFVLAEDQYGVGDLIEIGPTMGWVEKVSMRSVQLRDVDGKVWYIPHGKVDRVANLSYGWANAVLDVPVDRTLSVAQATESLEATLAAFASSDRWSGIVMDPPTVLGVQEVLDDRYLLRVVVKTRPAEQFAVMRAVRQLIVEASADGRLPIPEHASTIVVRSGPAAGSTPGPNMAPTSAPVGPTQPA